LKSVRITGAFKNEQETREVQNPFQTPVAHQTPNKLEPDSEDDEQEFYQKMIDEYMEDNKH
jgi:hypothetical protein